MNRTEKAPLRSRWWDIPAALLMLAALLTAAIRLAATNWTPHLNVVQSVAVLALAAGLALGYSVFSRKLVVGFAFLYGVFTITWRIGSALYNLLSWEERTISMAGRLSVSLTQLIQRKPVNDNILFLFTMGALFWALCVYAGYMLTRHGHPWQASLPLGVALFIIHIHDPYWPFRTWFLATYIFFSLLLLARMTYLHRHALWEQRHTRLPPYLGLDLIRTTLLATAILVLLAWTVPALASSVPLAEQAWKQVSRPWIIARSRMTNAFASLKASVGLVYDYYGDVLPLGRGNRLTDDIILMVTAPPSQPESVKRYYWRARVYDTYEDGLWTGTYNVARSVSPQNFDLALPELKGRWASTFEITPWVPLSTLFVISQPEWVSRPAGVDLALNDDGTVDIAAIHADINVQPGERYSVRSTLLSASVSSLRAAGTDYPDYIRERYLQLPATITPRTIDLAKQIAAPYENPYDIAVAVTAYLRNNIRYADTVPIPPTGQDPVDWVLFDLKQGFCNYYATAEIVLLRALGIPARWAVGYAQGDFDAATFTYQVRQRDAHSWPEVYFPGYGWVEFEPTTSQPALDRPVGDPLAEGENQDDGTLFNPDANPGLQETDPAIRSLDGSLLGGADGENTPAENPIVAGLVLAAALGLISVSLFTWRKRGRRRTIQPLPVLLETGLVRIGIRPPRLLRRWSRLASLPPLPRAYHEINRALTRLGQPPNPFNTPAERGAALNQLLPSAAPQVDSLLAHYQNTTYSLHPGDEQAAQVAARTVRNLSWLARLNMLLSRWQEPQPRAQNGRLRF